ncbi:MAG: hypothetical protein V3V14_03815 [Saprospiraceae bacterium]
MLDKNKIKVKDKGWQMMSNILDMEMPQQRKKRPILWIFLAIGMIAVLVLFSDKNTISKGQAEVKIVKVENAKNLNEIVPNIASNIEEKLVQKNKKNDANIQIKKNKIRSKNILSNLKSKVENTNTKKASLRQVENNSNVFTTNSLKINHQKKSIVDRPSIKASKSKVFSDLYNSINEIDRPNPQPIKQKSESKNVNKVPEVIENIEENEKGNIEILDNKKQFGEEFKEKKDLKNNTPKIQIEPKNNLKDEATNIDKQEIDKIIAQEDIGKIINPSIPIRSIFSGYLHTGGLYNHTYSKKGYNIGIGVDYGNKNASAFIETGYEYSKLSSSENTIKLVEDDNNTIEQGAKYYDYSLKDFSSLITSTKNLYINIGVRKSIFNNMYIRMSVVSKYYLDIKNKELTHQLNSNLPNDLEEFNITNTILKSTNSLSSIDIGPQIALQANVSNRISISAGYYYGLINLIKNTATIENVVVENKDDKLFINDFKVNIRYKF